MDWPIPEITEAYVRETEREAAKFGRGQMDAVAKMWQRLENQQRALACYGLAGRPVKVRRVSGERVYSITETLHLYDCGRDTIGLPLAEAYLELGDVFESWRLYAEAGHTSAIERLTGFCRPYCDTGLAVATNNVPHPVLPQVLEVAGFLKDALLEETARSQMQKEIDGATHQLSVEVPDAWYDRCGGDPAILATYAPPDRFHRAAKHYIRAGDYDMAMTCIKTEMKYTKGEKTSGSPISDASELFLRMAAVSYLRGDYHGAIGFLKQVGDTGDATDLIALVHMKMEDYRCAAGVLEAGLPSAWAKADMHGRDLCPAITARLKAVANLYALAGEESTASKWRSEAEKLCRMHGLWMRAVEIHFQNGALEEAERVCREEDELDVAAYLYESAGQRADAARILEEMAGISASSIVSDERGQNTDRKVANRKCPSCGAEAQAEQNFCGDCGQRLRHHCPSCGADIVGGKPYCGKCGARVNPRTA